MARRSVRDEQETTLRFDHGAERWHCYTANPATARLWAKNGHDVTVMSMTAEGDPTGWSATADPDQILDFVDRRLHGSAITQILADFVKNARRRKHRQT